MSFKRYDLFISYSHSQRPSIELLAKKLKHWRVNVWYDDWTMEPGDFLRDRVVSGIDQSRCLLVAISPDALESNWVKFELNCGFASEVDDLGIKIVPALLPGVSIKDLPTDLRARFCLDMRSAEKLHDSAYQLARMLNPDHYRRLEKVTEIKNEIRSSNLTVDELWQHMYGEYFGSLTQGIQLAVVARLNKIPGQEATLVLAERITSISRLSVIERTINALSRRRSQGGILALSSTFTLDFRVRHSKIVAINRATGLELPRFLEDDGIGVDYRTEYLNMFRGSGDDDLIHGANLCQFYDRSKDRFGRTLAQPADDAVLQAHQYADERLPGLVELLSSTNNFGLIGSS